MKIKIESFWSKIEGCQVWRVWFGNVGYLYYSEATAKAAAERGSR